MFAIAGCTTKEHYLIASTGTVIGVELAQNPVNQTPQAKLGYNRAEIAIVPTNRNPCVIDETKVSKETTGNETKILEETTKKKDVNCGSFNGNGAADTAEVLMELRYGGIFSWGDSNGIYQRLAVGEIAVAQPGASVMFAKKTDGSVDDEAAKALQTYYSNNSEQHEQAARIFRCYSGVKVGDRPSAWLDANEKNLFRNSDTYSKLIDWHNSANSSEGDESLALHRKANKRYASEIGITAGSDEARTGTLADHRQEVCKLAKRE